MNILIFARRKPREATVFQGLNGVLKTYSIIRIRSKDKLSGIAFVPYAVLTGDGPLSK
jgi:hypothetical protein